MMKTDAISIHSIHASAGWSTSSFGDTANTSPVELAALGEHLHHCKGSRGKLFALRCMAESANGFVASRFVTTLAVAAVLIGAACTLVT